ncbi:synaptic vesicle transporter [Myriangium duriaei CBS 260.36]|uniref:Synaptic vesicle transporter n=1 Tax=Myriangium duriaei CBS 260.36 TaxID=1168546 RepID=A0A9P4MMG7_9PEZI|nr:synaptic vesicle transporter [Myriangium duriaei CBS 260.36]
MSSKSLPSDPAVDNPATRTLPSDPEAPLDRTVTVGAHKYDTPLPRKCLIVFVLSWITLSACFSSTSLFTASDAIALSLHTTPLAVNLSSAGVLLIMGVSSFFWSPMTTILGRRVGYNACVAALLAFTLGTSFAKDFKTFAVLRVLSGLQGTYFHVAGQAILAQYFPPVQRGTATGFFLSGTVLGPPIGPLVAGIMVTSTTWRAILWLQAGMVGFGLILSLFAIQYNEEDEGVLGKASISEMIGYFNPGHVLRLMIYPNVFFAHLAAGFLSYAQYSLLSGPHIILKNQFHLTSPLVSGLFYIAPAAGFLAGTTIGGRYSDLTVRKWIDKRNGLRLPQDRLRSGMIAYFFIVPVSSLIYGWCLEKNVGGLPLAAIMAFILAAGTLIAFAGLNTYCAEVMPNQRPSVIAGKYAVQYTCGALGTATCQPLIDNVGVGAECTISAILVILAGILTTVTALYGLRMQKWVDEKRGRKPISSLPQEKSSV